MRYFEGNVLYEDFPRWAAGALNLGYRWHQGDNKTRRIGLLSMPCESEAAGLIALGALRGDLELSTANHVDTHFDLLQRTCRELVTRRMQGGELFDESSWDVSNTIDDTRWRFAGYDESLSTIVLESSTYRSVIKRNGRRIPNPNGPCNRFISQASSLNWQLRGLPLPQAPLGGMALELSAYSDLPSCEGKVLEDNLRSSYDGLVLIGHGAARDTAYMHKLYAVGFASDERWLPLGELLTLHHSDKKYIRRLRFLNERTQNESGFEARLVVADGISALLTAVRIFPSSDIIGVVNRDASIDALEQFRGWLNEIMRYYTDMDNDNCQPSTLPEKMLLRVLHRKVT